MATGLGLAHISQAQLNSPTPITPYYVQEWGSYLSYKPSYCQFSVKIFKFSLPWQQELVWHYFTSTVKFAYPDNPLRCAGMGVVSPIQVELLPIFCQNFQIFVAMATGVGLAQISLAQLNSPTPITPY